MESESIRPPGHELDTLQVFEPYPDIFAYYDGRTGDRFHSKEPNWLDDGAFILGVCTYAIVSGSQALLYDAGITPEMAGFMLDHVTKMGVTRIMTVYSHCHNDHIAGAVALKNSTIIGQVQTEATIRRRMDALAKDNPAIQAILPAELYERELTVKVGNRTVELHNFNIHTPDGTILFLPEERILFAGDTLEDTVTFIAEPSSLSTHQIELKRMADFPIDRILPAHGSPDRIKDGGYESTLIDATIRYIQAIDEPVEQPVAWTQSLKEVVAKDVEAGNLVYFSQYDNVHAENVRTIQRSRQEGMIAAE